MAGLFGRIEQVGPPAQHRAAERVTKLLWGSVAHARDVDRLGPELVDAVLIHRRLTAEQEGLGTVGRDDGDLKGGQHRAGMGPGGARFTLKSVLDDRMQEAGGPGDARLGAFTKSLTAPCLSLYTI